jgi:hypothetical protein
MFAGTQDMFEATIGFVKLVPILAGPRLRGLALAMAATPTIA